MNTIKSELVKVTEAAFGSKPASGELGKVERRLRTKRQRPAATEDPRAELRRLTRMHQNATRRAISMSAMVSDRKNRTTGETIKCDVTADTRAQHLVVAEAHKRDAEHLESAMLRELKKIPIYDRFLRHVYGIGPVVAAYLVSMLSVRPSLDPAVPAYRVIDGRERPNGWSEKPSQMKRFCGLAVIDGRLERRTRGQKLGYVSELRTRLFQCFAAMARNAAKRTEAAPLGKTSKYLEIWANVVHREKSAGRKGGYSKGRWKAADVLVEDLYTVWRALEGLPVWPSYYAAKLGYEHGGKICVNAPKQLTVDEALAVVGDVGARPNARPVVELGDEEALAAE